MIKKCVNCPGIFLVNLKNRNRKYCDVCKILVWKEQKKRNDLLRYRTTRIECDLFCVKCFASLPIGSHSDKMYCASCLPKHQKILKLKRRRAGMLAEFYSGLRINLIQSPYLVERKTLKENMLLVR